MLTLKDLTDLEICKRIARIEYPLCTYEWTKGKCDLEVHGEEYNPLTDDDILSKLIVKHYVTGWKKMTEREICLAIIEADSNANT